jgi:hypothetical protein
MGLLMIVFSLALGKYSLDTIFGMQNNQMAVSDDLVFIYLPLKQ